MILDGFTGDSSGIDFAFPIACGHRRHLAGSALRTAGHTAPVPCSSCVQGGGVQRGVQTTLATVLLAMLAKG